MARLEMPDPKSGAATTTTTTLKLPNLQGMECHGGPQGGSFV